MKKKVSIDVAERRPLNFANRITDIFERKFDGFPARLPPKQGRLQTEDGDIFGIDLEALIQKVIEEQGPLIPDSTILPCSGDATTITEVASGSGTSWSVSETPRYIVDVWDDDGTPLVEGLEYTAIGSAITTTESQTGVRVRYVL
jgi:hypothetical protein